MSITAEGRTGGGPVGSVPEVQGEVIGRANFLGLAKRYPLTAGETRFSIYVLFGVCVFFFFSLGGCSCFLRRGLV